MTFLSLFWSTGFSTLREHLKNMDRCQDSGSREVEDQGSRKVAEERRGQVQEDRGGERGGGVHGVWATGFAPTSWRCGGVGGEGGGASSKLEKVSRSSLPTHDITRRVPESGCGEQSTCRRREVCAVVEVDGRRWSVKTQAAA